MIKPTVGRVVWFYPSQEPPPRFVVHDRNQPCAAIIAFVYNDTTVTLNVSDHAGQPWGWERVLLWQGEGERPTERFCEWMPYQKGQAAKTEALEKHLAGPMTRKGELTRGRLNSEFSHHVALPAEKVRGAENSEAVWSLGRTLTMAQLTYTIRRGDNDQVVVYCFKEEADAQKFAERFGGERLAHKGR
jgi:hypothetical protein